MATKVMPRSRQGGGRSKSRSRMERADSPDEMLTEQDMIMIEAQNHTIQTLTQVVDKLKVDLDATNKENEK